MDLFNKATKVAREVGNSVMNTATSVGNSISNVTREQTELANLKIQKTSIEKKMESQYAEIGKRYVAYISSADNAQPFEVEDILDQMSPNLDKIAEVEAQIAEKEQQIRENNLERDRKKAQEQFDAEQRKLNKAKDLDILSDEEYDEKLALAQKKLDNFEILRKVQLQCEMGIISREEYEEKVKNILQ